ncbi:hypothetical protein Taro_046306 [Colocasia esculenta]|uniref:DYW domain-containing protein n=1 Tax=Colocasia esculenta TaxID=4460 RepID=A0A843X3Y7_COLES|nr:hypothetical protein [Colocasia esculenta]
MRRGKSTLADAAVAARIFPEHLNSLFPLCSTLPRLKQLHAQILIHGVQSLVYVGSKLAKVYLDLDHLRSARQLFDQIPIKNAHAWNTIISGYSTNRDLSEVLRLYGLMREGNHRPDSYSLVFVIRACTGLSALRAGSCAHCDALRAGLDAHRHVAPALVKMYTELGSLDDARKVADNVSTARSVVWGLMMKGYLQWSKVTEVFGLFARMKDLGIELDPFSSLHLAQACGDVGAGKEGSAVHGLCVKKNFLDSDPCLQTSLVDMYAKTGMLACAQRLFEDASARDIVLWSSMVARLAQNGKPCEALQIFQRMMETTVMPNEIILASALLANTQLGTLLHGKSIHGYVIRNGFRLDVVTYTALLDMYAKCGSIGCAYKVFNEMHVRNVFSWSAIIGGFGAHGMCSKALSLFNQMKLESIAPNSITFVSVLSACSHCGRVQEGRRHFQSMSKDYGITPKDEHYSCMVDLLGRAGLIDEAVNLINDIPAPPGASVWGALLGACRIHKRVQLAEKSASKLFILEPNQPGAYVLLSNIYAAAGMWDMVKKMRTMMTEKGLQKTFGFSSIEIRKKVYIFSVKNILQYHNTALGKVWCMLSSQMKALGYTPDISFALYNVDDEAKEEALCGHSEKLALACGLLNTGEGMPIRITKNLRVCGDCHTASKFVSLITEREIIMRDSKRFHHFKDEVCSCGDYW